MKNEDVLKKSSFLRIFFCFEGFDGFDGFDKICLMENGSSSFVFQVMRILKRPRLVNLHHARHGHEFCILMKRRGRVFRVRSKPSKQPLGLVARGVPIEKVRAKRAMHWDWARGVAGAWSRSHPEGAPGEVQLWTRPCIHGEAQLQTRPYL